MDMPVSHFRFRRGTDEYEVFVAKKWDEEKLLKIKPEKRPVQLLFLEEDDFAVGGDVFALDFFLMKQTGEHLEGKNLLEELIINDKDLCLCLEGEVRRLAAKTRLAYFRKEQIPGHAVLISLQGIAEGLKHLGCKQPLTAEEEQLFNADIRAAFFPRKRTGALLTLFQKWEKFLQER